MGLLDWMVVLCQSRFPNVDGYMVVVQESVFLCGKCTLQYRGVMVHQVYNLCEIVQKTIMEDRERGRCNRVKLESLGEEGIADVCTVLANFL